MLEGELPYVEWYQCRKCTHLFYNEKPKILAHLRDHHGYGSPKVAQQSPASSTSSTGVHSNSPLRGRDYQPRVRHVGSASSGTDGEENTLSEEAILNNNNNNDFASKMTFPRRKVRYFLKTNTLPEQKRHYAPYQHHPLPARDRVALTVKPSIEDLKRQLLKSDIDISEIKVNSQRHQQYQQRQLEEELEPEEDPDEVLDEDEIIDDEGDNNTDENEIYENEGMMGVRSSGGFHSGIYEEQEEENSEENEEQEGASTSNQSFYDNEGGHFLFHNNNVNGDGGEEGETESNYDESESTVTPNFSMVDEFYRKIDAASAAAEVEAAGGGGRKRTYFNPCKLCKRNFPSLSMLKKHAKTHLNEEGGSQHVCKFCFEYFPSAAGLSKHLRVHSGENPNVCQVCEKSFTSWATLRTHMKIHSGLRPFRCTYQNCEQRFQTKSTLDSHLRIHTGQRDYVCRICSKTFRTSSPLYRHMRSVHKGISLSAADS